MAGFMSGFGSAFSRSFELERERNAQREDDMFKIRFNTYLKNKEKYDETVAEGRKRVRLAKSLTEGTNPEAWSKVYEWLDSGMDEDEIRDRITNGEFAIEAGDLETKGPTPVGGPEEPDSNTDLSVSAKQSVDTQMEEAGMPIPEDGGLFGGLKKAAADRQKARIDERMSDVTGQTPEEIAQVESANPYEPEALPGVEGKTITWKPKPVIEPDKIQTLEEAELELMHAENSGDEGRMAVAKERVKILREVDLKKAMNDAEAKAKAEGTFSPQNMVAVFDEDRNYLYRTPATIGPDGTAIDMWGEPIQGIVKPLNAHVVKEIDSINEKLQKPTEEYLDKVGSLTAGIKLATEMSDLVQQSNGQVLLDTPGWITSAVVNPVREIFGAMDILTKQTLNSGFKTPDIEANIKKMEGMEQKIQEVLSGKIMDVSAQKALFEAKKRLAAYRLAAIEGQTGKAVTQADLERFEQMVSNSKDPQNFNASLYSYLAGQRDILKGQAKFINEQNRIVQGFKETYRFNPFPEIMDVDEYLKKSEDSAVQQGYETMNQAATGTLPAPEVTEDRVQIHSVEEFHKLPPGTKYIDPNGVKRTKGR